VLAENCQISIYFL